MRDLGSRIITGVGSLYNNTTMTSISVSTDSAPLYLQTLWHYKNAVIIIIIWQSTVRSVGPRRHHLFTFIAMLQPSADNELTAMS